VTATIDNQNKAFWNDLCGTSDAQRLGITDHSAASLERFDRWYFDFYPYLTRHIPFQELAGKRVLEVGLGYGSVAQRLMETGAVYHGLDIAENPVAMVRHRATLKGTLADIQRGSILQAPWPDASFDTVIALGCYHHTGNLNKAIAETKRMLKPGGKAILMVYNAYAHRRWMQHPVQMLRSWMIPVPRTQQATQEESAQYDRNASGDAAPETVFVSAAYLKEQMHDWSQVMITTENAWLPRPLNRLPRKWLLPTLGKWCGLDLYCHAAKPASGRQ